MKQSRQQPIAMNTGMPIKASVENRVQRRWRTRILGAGQDMVELVGVFPRDMAERNSREARADVRRQALSQLQFSKIGRIAGRASPRYGFVGSK